MFSPSSGSLNSLAPDAEAVSLEVGCVRTGDAAFVSGALVSAGDAGAAGFCATGGAATAEVWFEAAGADFPSAPSTVKMTLPSLILSPSLTRISCTVPVTDEGTSTTR